MHKQSPLSLLIIDKRKRLPRKAALKGEYMCNNDFKFISDISKETMNNVFADKTAKENAESQNNARFLKALENIADNTREIKELRLSLSAETTRANKAERRTRVLSVLLSVLACLSAYALEHHKEIIDFFLSSL